MKPAALNPMHPTAPSPVQPTASSAPQSELPVEASRPRPRPAFAGRARSPCISICRIDPADELCVGCQRTIDEIAGWGAMSPEQRLEIWRLIGERRAAAAGSKS